MKHKVCIYQETYTTIEIDAPDRESAEELVMSGEYNDNEVTDVTVKQSEIIPIPN